MTKNIDITRVNNQALDLMLNNNFTKEEILAEIERRKSVFKNKFKQHSGKFYKSNTNEYFVKVETWNGKENILHASSVRAYSFNKDSIQVSIENDFHLDQYTLEYYFNEYIECTSEEYENALHNAKRIIAFSKKILKINHIDDNSESDVFNLT